MCQLTCEVLCLLNEWFRVLDYDKRDNKLIQNIVIYITIFVLNVLN